MAEFLRSVSVATHTYTHTHTPAPDNRRLCPHWRGDGKELRSHTHTHTHTHRHTQTYTAAECCAGGALTSYRMCACLCTGLISVHCTATAAQRPQCGRDTCLGERGGGVGEEEEEEEGRGEEKGEQES